MLLRRSGNVNNKALQLEGVMANAETEIGVDHESILIKIAEAVFAGDAEQMAIVREEALQVLSPQALTDTIAVATGFNGITKVANATGILLDDATEQLTIEMRASTGIDEFSEATKHKLYG